MTKDEAVKLLNECPRDDQECAHGDADGVLLLFLNENGYKEIADAWEKVDEECGGFWYA